MWLATHGDLVQFAVGTVVSSPSLDVAGMYVVFSGRISIYPIREGCGTS